MADILLHIPTPYVTRAVDALKVRHPEYGDPESLLTENEMAKEAVRLWILHVIRTTERRAAVNDINIVVPEEAVTADVTLAPHAQGVIIDGTSKST